MAVPECKLQLECPKSNGSKSNCDRLLRVFSSKHYAVIAWWPKVLATGPWETELHVVVAPGGFSFHGSADVHMAGRVGSTVDGVRQSELSEISL